MNVRAKGALALAVALLVAGCSGGGEEATGGGDGGAGGSNPGGFGGRDGGRGGSGGAGSLDPEPPMAGAIEARVVGRNGRDLLVTVEGSDPNGDVVQLRLRLLDRAGADIPVVDTDRNGEPDASGIPAPFAVSVAGETSFAAAATLHRLLHRVPTLGSVGVRLVDAHGLESEERVVVVADQPVRDDGECCDPTAVADRCKDGRGCHGDPPTCGEGAAPEITRFAYVRTSTSPRILIEGTEPEDDLATIRIGFLSTRGEPISVDLDGDDTPDGDSFDFGVEDQARDGTFFLEINPIEGFDVEVPQLSATATDGHGHTGATQVAKAAVATKRNRGQTCDPRGFDACASGTACFPGIVGVDNRCEILSRIRDLELAAAPVLDPALGLAVAVGRAEGASVFDVPVDCSTGDPVDRPEAIVKLHLASPAARLTLSTIGPWTDFDTVVYLLPDSATSSANALGCGDDSPAGAASLLEIENVPAGDYLVVVDSWNPYGGSFELVVGVE
jgi:hypothetical protein